MALAGRETGPDEVEVATLGARSHKFELTVQVVAYPRDGKWYAEGTDMALMAEGASEDEAVRCVLEQSAMYIATVLDHGWLDRLQRPASLRHRLEVQARVSLARLRRQPAMKRTELVEV